MPRPVFEDFIAPARARPELWRLVVGLLLAVGIYLAFLAAVFIGLYLLVGQENTGLWMERVVDASSPTATLLLLLTFGGMALGAIAAARLMHGRSAATLFGPRDRVLRDFLIAGGIVAGVLGASLVLWLWRFDPEPGLDFALWLRFLPIALLAILLQTGAEEMLFRGYAQQQLAARFRSPLIWLILPSVVFGLVHFNPDGAGANAWIVVLSAGLFGLIAADLTAATGSLGAAWGFHFANNCIALLVIATKGTIPGLALYRTPYEADDAGMVPTLMLGDLVVIVIAWALVRVALRR